MRTTRIRNIEKKIGLDTWISKLGFELPKNTNIKFSSVVDKFSAFDTFLSTAQ